MQGEIADWDSVDELLFDGQVLGAMQEYMRLTDASLKDAIDAIDVRVAELKRERRDGFRVPLEGYGDGVYT